jgi:hypothetical protein
MIGLSSYNQTDTPNKGIWQGLFTTENIDECDYVIVSIILLKK